MATVDLVLVEKLIADRAALVHEREALIRRVERLTGKLEDIAGKAELGAKVCEAAHPFIAEGFTAIANFARKALKEDPDSVG